MSLYPLHILNNQPKPLDAEEKQIKYIQSIKDYSKGDVLLLHHHHRYPGIEDLHDYLLQAKQDVAKRGGEMFIFTIIRDQVAHPHFFRKLSSQMA